MNKSFFGFFLVMVFNTTGYGQNKLAISPEYPVPGDRITITYDPSATGATIADTVTGIQMAYTYSNFYELPWKMPLTKTGNLWQTSFVIPRYGVLATFYLQSGTQKDQPETGKHYAIKVYENNHQRVKSSYLYEGYSLSAQLGRSSDLAQKQTALFEEELKHYPDNYEAKLRLLVYQIARANETDKVTLRKKAEDIIAAKFHENPGNMGYMNRTTMGYLIIGENSRLDSLRKVVKKKYPETEGGYELRIDAIKGQSDSALMISELKALLKTENASNAVYLREAHDVLFKYYASQKQPGKALLHLQKLGNDQSPYKPESLKKQSETLYQNGIALDTALALAQQSLALADTFPISLIRYFPETGHLPAPVTREARQESIQNVTGNLKSLMALIKLKQGKKTEAAQLMATALNSAQDAETLANAGDYYHRAGSFQNAFNAYKMIAFDNPDDTTAFRKMKDNYVSWRKNDTGLDEEVGKLKDHWQQVMTEELEKEIISITAPEFLSNIVDLQGNPVPTDLFKNKIAILDFWATWCVPCMKEMPYLQRAYEQYKNDTNVVFMVINSGSKNELSDAQGWWGNKKFTFPVYYNTDKTIGEKLGFNIIPATYVIDTNNNIRFKTIGFEGPVIERKIPAAIELLKRQQAGDVDLQF